MAEVRACASILVFIMSLQIVTGKPFFGNMFCDMFCDEEDFTTSSEDYDLCDVCAPRRPPTTRPTPVGRPGDMSIMIPPSNGMNLTMAQNNGMWTMNFVPWPVGQLGAAGPPPPAGAAPPPPGAAPPPAGAAPPPAGAAPAPAAATPAPAAATPAPAATTVAPTTVAAG